ncbi:MAG: chromosomal replication initiator protein DnaA [Clostridia bacterium]|nr:chromosomal replication initiator protein DnaA [Clostridia bacterium]
MAFDNSEELNLIWNTIKSEMEESSTMSDAAYETWFSDFRLVKHDEKRIVFSTSTETKRKVIREKFSGFIQKSVENALGYCPAIEIICDPRKENENENAGFASILKTEEEGKCHGLNPEFTFDNFVVGTSNNFAHACASSVSQDPGGEHNYNPLFIYGPSGLGKTHLMYAAANKVHSEHPEMSIVCVKCEDFMNELIGHIKNHTTETFREKYRKVDMLLIDDIQIISGKETTQLEFFHTFDTLREAKKQIILTSDRPPKEMYTLAERIRTRFAQGMLVDIQPPEYELRLAIISKKADKTKIKLPPDVLTFLAERLNSNIREIEGAIKKIGAISFLSGKAITLEMVKSSIPEFLHENKPVTETIEKIIEVTARKYDVTVEEILGTKRTKNIKTARNVAMYIAKQILDLSLPQIGKFMNRDHSTVHSNIQNIESLLETDNQLSNDITEIITEVKS